MGVTGRQEDSEGEEGEGGNMIALSVLGLIILTGLLVLVMTIGTAFRRWDAPSVPIDKIEPRHDWGNYEEE